jgi:hypothetical protein
MPRVVFRSTFNRVLSIVAWGVLAALAIGTLLTPGAFTAAPGIVVGALGAAAIVWAVLWAPHVAVDDEAAEVANVLVDYRVPWGALIHVDTRYALVLHTPGRRISATAAPAPGAFAGVRATRAQRRSEQNTTPGVRPGDLPGTDSGRAADLVRTRWERQRDRGAFEAGLADSIPVTARPRTLSIATIVLGATALVCAVLLV